MYFGDIYLDRPASESTGEVNFAWGMSYRNKDTIVTV